MMKFQEKAQIDSGFVHLLKIFPQDAFNFMGLTIITIDTVSSRPDIFLIYLNVIPFQCS